MATNKKVIVLTPNGRRQNVAVTPNTTILQVIQNFSYLIVSTNIAIIVVFLVDIGGSLPKAWI